MSSRYTRANSNYLLWSNPGYTLPISFMAWVYVHDVTNTQVIFGIVTSSTAYITLNLMGGVASDPFQVLARAGGTPKTASIVGATINTWHCVSCILTSDTSRIVRVDGSSAQDTNNIAFPSSPDFSIGGIAAGNTSDLRIMWPCIWDVALTGAQILAMEQGAHPRSVMGHKILKFEDHVSPMANNKPFVLGSDPSTYNGTWAALEASKPGLSPLYGGA